MKHRFILFPLVAALLACASGYASAHKPSDSYLTLKVSDTGIDGQWDIALRDLEYAIGLDANGDGDITWGELKQKHGDIADFALARLSLSADGALCQPRVTDHLVDQHSDGAYAVLNFFASCGNTPIRNLEARYNLFFDLDAQHKGLLRLENNALSRSSIFSADSRTQRFVLTESSTLEQFATFIKEGVWHIWIGFDHILFILSLLLPSVLVFRASSWQPAEKARPVFLDVLKVVTAFTFAHSITLSLAALEIITLPSRLVEATIAASVVLAAINNLRPVVLGRRWLVALIFGLIHGFGFASVLADLGLPQEQLLLALVGFNLGVELGQLAIVCAFLPLAFLGRQSTIYRKVIMLGGSGIIATLALIWFIERAFDVKILT
jgi:hypothetical protein